jgi:hypothetical protein
MSRRIVCSAAAAFGMTAALLVTPATAAGEFTITVTPDEGLPTSSFTVTGDATDPICADDGVAVSLHYTKPDGSTGSASVNTVTDSAGHFTANLTVPETAYAGEDASVAAVIADCTPPDASPAFARSSISVPFDVLAYDGVFHISKKSGKPGQVVTFSGTNCYGGAVAVFFGDDVLSGTPEQDRTFAGEYTLPNVKTGTYEFGAECPGTDYQVFSFSLVNPVVAPPAPPARPVVRPPTFTG